MLVKYSDVISGKVKADAKGSICLIQFVSWAGVPIEMKTHKFHTLGYVDVVVPPPLPIGFKMERCWDWGVLHQSILAGYMTATFEQLDLMNLDLHALAELTGGWGGDYFNPLYDDRPDWSDWGAAFEDAWAEAEEAVEQLFHRALPHLPPHASIQVLKEHIADNNLDCKPIGNRTMPPSMAEILKTMLAIVEAEVEE